MTRRIGLALFTLCILAVVAACGQRAPSPAPDPPIPPPDWEIESRAEHRVAVDHLIELANQIEGVSHITAVILEGRALIGIEPDPHEEAPLNRSLEEEVARRAVEMSPFVTDARVSTDGDLTQRIASARRRIDAGERTDALRQEVYALWSLLESFGTAAY